jgi:hypothetical protein
MDQQLGKLFSKVRDDAHLRNNTLIIVASDNGHEDGAGRSDPLRGSKTWLYEGGIRSPLIVWGPGLIDSKATGTTNTESILCAMDINASLYPITHLSSPAAMELDGEPLAATLLGKSQTSRSQPIFWRRPPDRPGNQREDNPDLAVRDGRWKLLVNFDGSKPQLFDLNQDIREQQNLATAHPKITSRLQTAVFQWNEQMPADAAVPGFKAGGNATTPLAGNLFINPIGEGADPWVIRDPIILVTCGACPRAIRGSRSIPPIVWNRWDKNTLSGTRRQRVLIQKRSGLLNCTSWTAGGTSTLQHLMATTPIICRMYCKAGATTRLDPTRCMVP